MKPYIMHNRFKKYKTMWNFVYSTEVLIANQILDQNSFKCSLCFRDLIYPRRFFRYLLSILIDASVLLFYFCTHCFRNIILIIEFVRIPTDTRIGKRVPNINLATEKSPTSEDPELTPDHQLSYAFYILSILKNTSIVSLLLMYFKRRK